MIRLFVNNPDVFKKTLENMELEASNALRSGDYSKAYSLYQLILLNIFEIQKYTSKRIHKGSYYYNLALSSLLLDNINSALKNYILAYIEDVITYDIEKHLDSKKLPAYKILHDVYYVKENYLNDLQSFILDNSDPITHILDPNNIFNNYSDISKIDESNITNICEKIPDSEDIKNIILKYVSPEANVILQRILSETGNRIIEIAASIAKNKGRPNKIEEEDIIDAYKKIGGNINE